MVELPGFFVIRVSLSEINDRRVDCNRKHHVLISDCFASGGIRGYFLPASSHLGVVSSGSCSNYPSFLAAGLLQ
jgi:hypothetical protein